MNIKKYIKGFTLAELMAVVVIVAILAGVAIGTYRKTGDKALFSEGLAASHAIASAVDAYYYENGYQMPSSFSKLDISLSKSTGDVSTRTIQTQNFTYKYTDSYVQATPRDNSKSFYIRTYLEKLGRAQADKCFGDIQVCKSVGFTSCGTDSCVQGVGPISS